MEKVYRFGIDRSLTGVVTVPDVAYLREGAPAVLLWNAGLVHRVGPFRHYVELARQLASMGFVVLRFDLSGIGDSEARKDSRSSEERAIAEIQEAMSFLSENKGSRDFVLIGLCSGAIDAHQAAIRDSRVSGAVMLDGYVFPTWRFYVRHYAPRVLSLTKWVGFLKRNIKKRVHKDESEAGIADYLNFREIPPKDIVRTDLAKLVERGVSLLYIYTGGVTDYYNYRRQLQDAFRSVNFRGQVQVEYFDEADHTYVLLKDRERVTATICDWIVSNYKPETEDRGQLKRDRGELRN